MNQQEFNEYYKKNPDKFIEKFYPNIKLYQYQKLFLRFIAKYKNVYFTRLWGFRK